MTFRFTEDDKRRFMSYVMKHPCGCWIWIGGRSRGKGNKTWYGSFWIDGRTRRAHIVAAVMFGKGHVPGHHEDHLCNFTLCVAPDHVETVTQAVNQQRKMERQRERAAFIASALQHAINLGNLQ
jgi:hypothetical protein